MSPPTITHRVLLIMTVGLVGGGAALGQSTTSAVYSKALPPSKDVLSRLNLYSEWSSYIPLDGRADGLAEVQVVDAGQIFVQTRAGRLVAVDTATGAKQWAFRYPRAYANTYPVGVTDRFVFAVNVGQLYCFHRYTGLLEFSFELPAAVSAGPVADDLNVYLSFGATKAACYRYPQPITTDRVGDDVADAGADPAAGPGVGAGGRVLRGGTTAANPADQVATRYADRFMPDPFDAPVFEPTRMPDRTTVYGDEFGGGNQVSPSLSALPRVSPPYTMHRYSTSPSVSMLPSPPGAVHVPAVVHAVQPADALDRDAARRRWPGCPSWPTSSPSRSSRSWSGTCSRPAGWSSSRSSPTRCRTWAARRSGTRRPRR